MNRPPKLLSIISPLILLLLTAGSAAAAEPWESSQEPGPVLTAAESAVRQEDERQVETHEAKGGFLGYSFVGGEGYGGRAEPYGYLRSSKSGGLYYKNLQKDQNLDLEGSFLNEKDYHGDLVLDYRGDYRLHLRTESLFHNLSRELLFTPDFRSGRTDLATPSDALYQASQQDARVNYGISFAQDLAAFRYRVHDFPLHVNLGYWRLVKQGTEQQRFADASFEGPVNTVFAQSRAVDRQTHEGSFGIDAHLGWVDLIYDLRVRYFEDRLATPTSDYIARNSVSRNGVDGAPERLGGVQQHNEDPDSRFISHTVKLHSSIAGGLVGSASYSLGERENLSNLTDTTGARHMKAIQQNAAGDLVYTPRPGYTMALKYRRQEIDNDDRGPISSINFVDPVQVVKQQMDLTKDVVIGTVTYRPVRVFSITGEYRGEFLKRTNVSALPTLTTWALPENTETHTGSVSLLYRPAKGMRISGKYGYATTDHPSYGTSFEQKHQGEFLATYTSGSNWGVTGNAVIRRESNDHVEHFLVNAPFADPVTYTASAPLSRERRTENVNFSCWVAPLPQLTLTANYAFLYNRVEQGVLFTGVFEGSEAATDFVNHSHVYSLNGSYTFNDKLDLSLMLQQIRSSAVFSPDPVNFAVVPGSTEGIRTITEQHSVINTVSTRCQYRFTRELSSSLEYTLREYRESNPAFAGYNGTVYAIAAYLTTNW